LELKEIRYFAQVARAGSFNRAAEQLRIAQPALSRKVRKLEEELGTELLVRHGRGIRLTAAGAMLLQRAEAIVHLVRQTSEDIRARSEEETGHVSLGVPPAAGLLLVPPIVEVFRKQFPHVSLHVREGISSSLQEWVIDRRIDLAILHNPPALQSLEIWPIVSERMVLIGPKGGARKPKLAPPPSLRLRDLAEYPLIMPSLPHNNRRLLEQAATQHGVDLNIVLEVDSVVLTKALVKRGLGYSMITYAAVQDEAQRNELSVFRIERPSLLSIVAVAISRDAQPSPHARKLISILRFVVQTLIADGKWAGGKLLNAGDDPKIAAR